MADTPRKPPVPPGLAPRGPGRRMWRSIVGRYELRPDELAHLEGACRAADLAGRLEAELADVPATTAGSRGQPAAHPLIGEWRSTVSLVAQLLARIDLPDGGAVAWDGLSSSQRARKAARARWDSRGA